MADNVTADPGTGGATFATDEDVANSRHVPYSKIMFGGDGTFTILSTTDPLPVDLRTDNLAGNVDINVAASTLDLALGTDISDVFGTASLILATQADDVANTADGLQTTSFLYGFDGTTWDRLRGDATNGLLVNLGANNDVTIAANSSVNVAQVAGTATSVNAGTVDAGTQRVIIASDQGALDVSGATVTVSGSGTFTVDSELPAAAAISAENQSAPTAPSVYGFGMVFDGTNWDRMPGTSADGTLVNLGTNNDVSVTGTVTVTDDGSFTLASNSGVDIGDVDVLSIAAGSNLVGDVGLGVRTSGGASFHKSIDLDETEEEVKATAGQVYGWWMMNQSAGTRYVKLYNATAATVVVGTTAPDLTLAVPAGAAANVCLPVPLAFDTAITIACTTGVADNDTGAPAANDMVVMLWFN